MTKFILCGGVITPEAAAHLENLRCVVMCNWGTRDVVSQYHGGQQLANALFGWMAGFPALRWGRPSLDFLVNLQGADLVVLPGGNTPTLIHYLQKAGLTREHLRDKTVLAVSAGVGALTAKSFNVDHGCVIHGLGILPLASIVHYQSLVAGDEFDWDEAEAQLKKAGPKTKGELYLRNTEHVVVEMDEEGGVEISTPCR